MLVPRTACTSLPLILHIIDAKLSPQANIKLHGLRNLVESVRPDSTDWFYGAIHGIIGLAQLEEPDPTSTITPNELTLSEITSHNSNPRGGESTVSSEMGLHPSIYLRLALSLDWGMSNSELPNADQLSSCLLRMFATSSVNRIRTILNEGLRSGRSPTDVFAEANHMTAARTVSGGEEFDQQQQDECSDGQIPRDLDWSEQDQAILFGLQLGIISPDMAVEWAEDVVSPESLPTFSEDGGSAGSAGGPQTPCEAAIHGRGHEQQEEQHSAKWKEIAGQAFSDTVDIPERNVLDAFIFRDQLPGEQRALLPDVGVAVGHALMKGDGPAGGGDAGAYHGKTTGAVNMAMATTLLDGLGPEQVDMVVDNWPVR